MIKRFCGLYLIDEDDQLANCEKIGTTKKENDLIEFLQKQNVIND